MSFFNSRIFQNISAVSYCRLSAFPAVFISAFLVGCAANNGAAPEAGSVPAPYVAAPANANSSAVAPENTSPADTKPLAAKAEGAAVVDPKKIAAPASPTMREPPPRAIQHFTSFYGPEVAVYDEPYGPVRQRISEKSLPREPTHANDGGLGVPVYENKSAFVKVRLADGEYRWVTIDSGRLTAKACELSDQRVRKARGPIGAGSSEVTCVEKAKSS
jgi:hypothetical protein